MHSFMLHSFLKHWGNYDLEDQLDEAIEEENFNPLQMRSWFCPEMADHILYSVTAW